MGYEGGIMGLREVWVKRGLTVYLDFSILILSHETGFPRKKGVVRLLIYYYLNLNKSPPFEA